MEVAVYEWMNRIEAKLDYLINELKAAEEKAKKPKLKEE